MWLDLNPFTFYADAFRVVLLHHGEVGIAAHRDRGGDCVALLLIGHRDLPPARSALRGFPVSAPLVEARGLGKAYPKVHRTRDRLRALARLLVGAAAAIATRCCAMSISTSRAANRSA